MHRPNNVLNVLLPSVRECSVDLSLDFTKYLVADQNTPGISQCLQPRRDVHTLTVNISALFDDDITEIKADSKLQRCVREFGLDCQCTPRGRDGTCELREKSIARGLDQSPLVLGNLRLNDLAP